jgi:S1-C subfamily serine protease
MQRHSPALFFGLGIVTFAASALVVGVGHAEWSIFGLGGGNASSAAPAAQTAPVSTGGYDEDRIVDTVQRVEPAVASVIITKDLPKMEIVNGDDATGGAFPDDPLFRNFRIVVPQVRQNGTEKREVGGGTAFFVGDDGLLMTNRHVVADEKAEYSVLLNDGRTLPATVVGRDATNDVALLKVEGSGFPTLSIAEDDDVKLGQTAIAIGNSLGEFRNTVSVGVVSGLQRSITAGNRASGTERLDRIIQTDAAINEGNSGGPLLDSRGNVIGMNTAVANGGQNIGFALSAKDLRRTLENYRKNGKLVRAGIGVRYVEVTPELQKSNDLAYDHGALIARGETQDDLAVMPGSAADKAGLRENDIILEADGTKITEDTTLQDVIGDKNVGDTVTLKVASQGKEKTVTVTLQELK